LTDKPREKRTSETEQPAIDLLLLTALDRLLPGHAGEFAVGGRSFLVRLPHDGSHIRARRWPARTAQERVRFVHELLSCLHKAAPSLAAAPVPGENAESWIAMDGSVVDIETWISGSAAGGRSTPRLPDGHALHRPTALEPTVQSALAARIAEAHLHSSLLARQRGVPAAPTEQLLRAINERWSDWRVRLRPIAPNYPPIQRWIRLGEQILPAAAESLQAGDLDAHSPVVAHLDLWPAHVLVDGVTIRLLDFSSAVATSPLMDVAQLVTRFTGWTAEHAEAAIAAYSDVRTLTPGERRLLPAMAALDLIVESARLLYYGYSGAIPPASRESSAARNGALDTLNSLEAVMPAVVRAAAPVSHSRRRQLTRIAAGKTKSSGPRQPIKNPNSVKRRDT
jgi:hypothetical protein